MSILLKNGKVIDYKNSIFEKYDILIENETLKEITKNIKELVIKIISKSTVTIGFTSICPMLKKKAST